MKIQRALSLFGLVALLSPGWSVVSAEESQPDSTFPELTLKQLGPKPAQKEKSIHPPIPFLDKNGQAVVENNSPVSLTKTCGACHDVDYISKHNYHSMVGLDEAKQPGSTPSGRVWDTSPGMFGRFNPLIYRNLSHTGSKKLDMGTADWIKVMGPRHVGGGPAAMSRYSDQPLANHEDSSSVDPETHVSDPLTGKPLLWDWSKSGTVELNCLLCHVTNPNNSARIDEIRKGNFGGASTASLLGSGIVERSADGWQWNQAAFDKDGCPNLIVSSPKNANCRLCHGRACRCTDKVLFENSLDNWAVETTGEIFSAERVSESAMNLENKEDLTTAWDVHAGRMLKCSNCHYSMNNPKYKSAETVVTKPRHLRFDARTLATNDYLLKPDHNLAKGHSTQGTVARRFNGNMRNCIDCHAAEDMHEFLPYKKVHFDKLSCQACHIPKSYAPTRKVTDWTVITPQGNPLIEHRGVSGKINDPASIIKGFKPVLLLQKRGNLGTKLSPHNLITSWFWVEGQPEHPVRLFDLKKAYFVEDGIYHPDVIAALDNNKDGNLSADELRLDNSAKTAAIARRLKSVSVENPRIKGEIQPYSLSHGIASGKNALKNCLSCHSFQSRVIANIELASYVPGGVIPEVVGDSQTLLSGNLFHKTVTREGSPALVYHPTIDPEEVYIHGTSHLQWLDILGVLLLVGTLMFIFAHAGLRIITSRKRKMVS